MTAQKHIAWILKKSTSQTAQARDAGFCSSNITHTEYFAAKTVTQGPFGEGCQIWHHPPSPVPPVPVTEAWVEKPSFGKPLEEHLAVSGREIAFPVEACVTMLLECGMQEEVSPCWKEGCRNRRGPAGGGDRRSESHAPSLLDTMEGVPGVPRARVRNWGAPGTSPAPSLVQHSLCPRPRVSSEWLPRPPS